MAEQKFLGTLNKGGTVPQIAERDHEGTLRCLVCGGRTGHEALVTRPAPHRLSGAICHCWPHEVANIIQEDATNE